MSEASVSSREVFDWNAEMRAVGFDTPDAIGNWGASRVQMELFLDIHGINWGHVQDAIDRGVLEPIRRTVEMSPTDDTHTERIIRYRNLHIEERDQR